MPQTFKLNESLKQRLASYDVYIFDCDGVILNSNQLKIEAMGLAVSQYISQPEYVQQCVDYFAQNFGRSRFHHVNHFVENILPSSLEEAALEDKILDAYSKQCYSLYLQAEVTPEFTAFIQSLDGKKYVASGSEQEELRAVFKAKKLDHYFVDILGSPTAKSQLVGDILNRENTTNAIMLGDAVSDHQAAASNDIDFVWYSPYSNVTDKMHTLCTQLSLPIISHFSEVV